MCFNNQLRLIQNAKIKNQNDNSKFKILHLTLSFCILIFDF